jgi:hypothetical protein
MYRAKGLEPFDDASALLGLLTDEPSLHWSIQELQNHLGWSPERLSDTIGELVRDGLAHEMNGFCRPSRAATQARLLLT